MRRLANWPTGMLTAPSALQSLTEFDEIDGASCCEKCLSAVSLQAIQKS